MIKFSQVSFLYKLHSKNSDFFFLCDCIKLHGDVKKIHVCYEITTDAY